MRPSLTLLALVCAASSAFAQIQKSFETPSYVQFSNPRYEVTEGETNAVVTVIRTGDFRKTAQVAFTTADGSAESNVDFEPCGGTLVFGSGQSMKTITIPILREEPAVASKSFVVQLQEPGFDTIVLTESAEIEIKPQPPALAIEKAPNGLIVSWADVGLPFKLEARDGDAWVAVTEGISLNEGTFLAEVAPSAPLVFFRLRLEAE